MPKRVESLMVKIKVSKKELNDFCHRYRVRRLALFGSVVGNGFRAESDVDILITFQPDADWGLFDHARMKAELQNMLGRKVDLVTRRALEQTQNKLLRDRILRSAKTIYPANKAEYAKG